jgi:hypothetical protein
MRYLIWCHAPAPGSTAFNEDFAMMLRNADGSVDVVHDRHAFGIFARETWLEAFRSAGFPAPRVRHDPWRNDVFVARRE